MVGWLRGWGFRVSRVVTRRRQGMLGKAKQPFGEFTHSYMHSSSWT